MAKCIICIGPPCSGKTTWTEKQGLAVLSCDQIRNELSGGKKYVFNPKKEKEVWESFYMRIKLFNKDFIVDNTNCKMSYIRDIINNLNPGYKVEYRMFDVPLWKLYYRNIKRWIFNDKFIPFRVIRDMKKNFNNLKKMQCKIYGSATLMEQ